MFLADAAPNGTGLAIVAVIFLVFIAVCLGVFVIVFRAIRRRLKARDNQ